MSDPQPTAEVHPSRTRKLTPEDERERIEFLCRSDLVATGTQEVFDRLTRLTTRLLDVPVSLISLVETHRQVFLGVTGLTDDRGRPRTETPRSHSFCQQTLGGTPFVVDDARTNEHVAENPLVEQLGVIAYLGVPLVVSGHVLGALCAIDHKPRKWTKAELETLTEISHSAVTEFELRRKIHQLERARRKIENLERLLPVCAGCKAICDATGAWKTLENYFKDGGTACTHSFCPDCMEHHFGSQAPEASQR